MNYTAGSLFDLVKQEIPDGIHTYVCSKNNISLEFEIINYSESIVLSETKSFGNTTSDSQMLILKFKNDLIINSGVIVTPIVRKKGMLIFCAGKLTNNGTITMTGKGAIATGEDVYLYKEEYVPAKGGLGGASVRVTGTGETGVGKKGNAGTARQTGGGGSGSARNWLYSATSGKGGNGTSYSGGSGSGAANSDGSGGATSISADGSNIGGPGSNGNVRAYNASGFGPVSMGGTGNMSGNYEYYRYAPINVVMRHGTGGLLIIFAKTLENRNNITSEGIATSTASKANQNQSFICTGGASGGGSVNVFCEELIEQGNVSAAGGASLTANLMGGAGGDGCVTIQQVNLNLYSNLIFNNTKKAILEHQLIQNTILSTIE